ncbi:MAG: hypothetical protein AAGF11_09995 [Myxococcota bacterium]
MGDVVRTKTWRLGLAPLLLALACDSAPADERIELEARTLVGTVEGTDLALGVLLDDDTIDIYQCGGEQTFDTHSYWFRGVIGAGEDPNAFEIEREGFTVVGVRTAEGLEGELVEPDGTRHPFHTDPIADEDVPGVYVAEHDGRTTGVIVRQDGDTLVAQGSSCTSTQPRRCDQVIILAPLTVESGQIDVQVETDNEALSVAVARTLIVPDWL